MAGQLLHYTLQIVMNKKWEVHLARQQKANGKWSFTGKMQYDQLKFHVNTSTLAFDLLHDWRFLSYKQQHNITLPLKSKAGVNFSCTVFYRFLTYHYSIAQIL